MTTSEPSATSISRRHISYLIRLWQSGPNGPWRASARSVQSGETIRFADLASFFVFLEGQANAAEFEQVDLSSPFSH